jgi:hypothetical protein
MFGKDKEIKKSDETLLLKELLRLGQRIEDFKTEVAKSIWHLERRVETIQVKLSIDPNGSYKKR